MLWWSGSRGIGGGIVRSLACTGRRGVLVLGEEVYTIVREFEYKLDVAKLHEKTSVSELDMYRTGSCEKEV